MKKMLVLALATVAFAGQARAIEGREKPEELRARIEREAKAGAAKEGKISPKAAQDSQAVVSSPLASGLSGNQAHDLQAAMNDAVLHKAAMEIVASHSAKTESLNKARLEGIANLGKLSPAVRNLDAELGLPEQQKEQAYAALVLSAGKQAAGWPEATEKNVVQLLEIANESIRSGKSVGDAMDFAKSELKRLAGVDIKLEDIKRLCKTA